MMSEGITTSATIAYQQQAMIGLKQAVEQDAQAVSLLEQAAANGAAQVQGPPAAEGKGLSVDIYV
jgi:hypothetical protein